MKKLLSSIFLISLLSLPAFCEQNVGVNEEQEEMFLSDIQQEEVNPEEKIMEDDTIYFDIENYKKHKAEGKVFKLKIQQNEDLLKHDNIRQGIDFKTKYTDTAVAKSKFNNKTTISSQTMTNANVLGENFSVGYGAELKEYINFPDTTNYSSLTTSLYSQWKIKNLVLEGELGQDNNVITKAITNKVSFGPKFYLTKSATIKGSVTKNFGDDTIWNEVAIVFQPIKSKRNFYLEFDATTSNAQYNIPQRRLQFFGRIKI